MKGLELSEQYYRAYGERMLREEFPAYADRIAVGLAGEGSECFGYDDAYSQDHDWGPAFSMWLTDGDYAEIGEQLQKAYLSLPEEFLGYKRKTEQGLSYGRTGVMSVSSYYLKYTGTPTGPRTLSEWARIPESFLAAAVNGKVFTDPLGQFTEIRNHLLSFYPEEIRKKKLSVRCAVMGQAGQYNYPRACKRENHASAVIFLADFLKAAGSAVYLLNRRYAPYEKWLHYGLDQLPLLSDTAVLFDCLSMNRIDDPDNVSIIEEICNRILDELHHQGISTFEDTFMWSQAFHIMEKIENKQIREMDVLEDFG